MSLKNREYTISQEDVLLLQSTHSSITPLRKKPLAPKPIQLVDVSIHTSYDLPPPIPLCSQKINLGHSLGIDKIKRRKMDQGQLPIDICIDLHGMTVQQAFTLFVKTINEAYIKQSRIVLIITGKGNHALSTGILKKELTTWLDLPHVAGKIVRASQAAPQHGGSGAFYILIRRIRS